MKSKTGKILKVIPGISPNFSDGWIALSSVMLTLAGTLPVYSVISFVASVILQKRKVEGG
jgi:hypothetical protein